MLKRIEKLILFSVICTGVFSFSAFAETTSSGNSRVAVTLADIITLRILDSSASSEISNLILDVTPTPNGVFTKNSMIVEAATSNPTGYKLYMSSIGTNPVNNSLETESDNASASGASGASGSTSPAYTTDLINIDNTINDSIPTLATGANVTEVDFRVRNSLYKNKWGYSLASLDITDTSAITYTDIPANTEQRLIDEKEEQTEHGQTPVTIGVNVSSAIASGTYKNKLEFTAIANPIPVDYSLSFDANLDSLSTWSVNIPEEQSVTSVASSYTFTIPSDIPISRSNFKEYNTRIDGTGDAYQPGDSIELIGDATNPDATKLILYVIWEDCAAPEGGFCDTNGHMWTKVLGTTSWYNINSLCPSGYHAPSLAEIFAFVGTSHTGVTSIQDGANAANLRKGYESAGWSEYIIWITTASGGSPYCLGIWSFQANIFASDKPYDSRGAVCTK